MITLVKLVEEVFEETQRKITNYHNVVGEMYISYIRRKLVNVFSHLSNEFAQH